MSWLPLFPFCPHQNTQNVWSDSDGPIWFFERQECDVRRGWCRSWSGFQRCPCSFYSHSSALLSCNSSAWKDAGARSTINMDNMFLFLFIGCRADNVALFCNSSFAHHSFVSFNKNRRNKLQSYVPPEVHDLWWALSSWPLKSVASGFLLRRNGGAKKSPLYFLF